MFSKKITAEVLSSEERRKITEKFPCEEVVRLTNNKTGKVLYVTFSESSPDDYFLDGPQDDHSSGEMRILDDKFKELDSISPLKLKLGNVWTCDYPVSINSYRSQIASACFNVSGYPESKLYETAVEAIGNKRIGDYVKECKGLNAKEEELRRRQKTGIAAHFFGFFNKER